MKMKKKKKRVMKKIMNSNREPTTLPKSIDKVSTFID
jgi:hypothetical protein